MWALLSLFLFAALSPASNRDWYAIALNATPSGLSIALGNDGYAHSTASIRIVQTDLNGQVISTSRKVIYVRATISHGAFTPQGNLWVQLLDHSYWYDLLDSNGNYLKREVRLKPFADLLAASDEHLIFGDFHQFDFERIAGPTPSHEGTAHLPGNLIALPGENNEAIILNRLTGQIANVASNGSIRQWPTAFALRVRAAAASQGKIYLLTSAGDVFSIDSQGNVVAELQLSIKPKLRFIAVCGSRLYASDVFGHITTYALHNQ